MEAWQVDVSGTTTVRGPTGVAELRAKERSIVAALALHHPEPATAATLAPLVWGDELPATAVKSIHNHISRLRTSVPGLVLTASGGYQLAADVDISSRGGIGSYHDLAEQPQVAFARARDRLQALIDDEEAIRPEVRSGADDALAKRIAALVEVAPHRLIRWWWLALVRARLGQRQRALDTLRDLRRSPVSFDRQSHRAVDRLEHAIVTDDVFLDSVAAAEPRSLGADVADVGGAGTASAVAPVGIIDTTGVIGEIIDRLSDARASLALTGPPGCGKTSIVRSLVEQLPRLGWHCYATTCSPVHDDPTAPLVHLDALRREREGLGIGQSRRHVGAASGDWANALVLDLTRRADRPILLIVDDVHHADEATLRHVEQLVAAACASDGNVLILLASRTSTSTRRAGALDEIEVPAWTHEAVETYLHSFVAPGAWSQGAAKWIHEHSDGNALFVRELTVEALRRLPDDPTATPFARAAMSGSHRATPTGRVDALPAAVREVLLYAAVLGDEFRSEDLARLCPDPAPKIGVAGAHGLIEPLDDDRHRFVHQTFRQSLLDQLDTDELTTITQSIARVIGRTADRQNRLAELARFARSVSAADAEHAIATTMAQAHSALTGLRSEEATNVGRLAIRLIEDHEGRSIRWCEMAVLAGVAGVDAGDPDAAEVLVAGGTRAIELGAHDLLGTAVSRLSSLSPATGVGAVENDTQRLLDHALTNVTNPAMRARVCLGAAFAAALAGDSDRSRTLYFEADALTRDLGDEDARSDVLLASYTPLSEPDDVPLRREIAAELHESARRNGRIDLDYEGYRLDFGDSIHWGLGDPRVPMRSIEEIAAQLGQRSRNWSLYAFRTTIALLDGDLEMAEHHCNLLLSDEVTVSPALATSTYGAHLIAIRMAQGRLDELDPIVISLIENQPLPIWDAVRSATAASSDPRAARRSFDLVFDRDGHRLPAGFTRSSGLTIAAEGALRLGDTERIETMLSHLVPFADRWAFFNVGTIGPVDLTLGRLHAALGNRPAARECARRGLASTARVGAPGFAAQLAALLMDTA